MSTTISTSTTPVTVSASGDTVTVDVAPSTVAVTAGVAGPQGPAVSLGTATPSTAGTATATAGTATTASASDHRHALGAHASTHAAAGSDPITISESQVTGLTSDLAGKAAAAALLNALGHGTDAIDVLPRHSVNAQGGSSITSGVMYAIGFTPVVDLTVSQISFASGNGAASGLTLCRFGLFTVSGNDVTLVARTASDTTIFASQSTLYTRSFDTTGGYPGTYNLTAGTRYAVGLIIVGTTMPNVIGTAAIAAMLAVSALSPWITANVSGQTDLPTAATTLTPGSSSTRWARIS